MRPSIAPEKLLRAMLIQVLFSVRNERQLMEQIRYDLLYRRFIGLAIDDEIWDHSVFSKNRDRLLGHAVVERFFTEVMQLANKRKLLSKEHFSVDGTLIQAWASHKSFVPKDGGGSDSVVFTKTGQPIQSTARRPQRFKIDRVRILRAPVIIDATT